MFGGHALYRDAVLIGIVLEEAPYLKADAQTWPLFEAAGYAPCVYTRQRAPITMSYWSVPEAALDSRQAMLPWVLPAYAASLRKPAKARRRGFK